MSEKLKDALVLLVEIAALLVVFVLFLLVLSYFKIITLPNFLPNSITSNTAPSNSAVVNNTNQNTIPVSFVKLANQAPDAQIQKYEAFATKFSKPTAQANPNDYVSDAVFSGYDSKTIQVVTKEGVLNLSFDANTLFQKYAARQTNAPGLIGPTAYVSVQDFSKNVVFGSTVQIWYSKPGLKTTQVNYAEAIKPIL
jgi:hypothetical protein